jgi:tetratricopeptide (TPR) repeat protein
MLTRFNRLLIVILIVGVACYAFYLNPGSITVNFGSAGQLEAPLAIVLLTTFTLGVFVSGLIALFFGIKSHFREKDLRSKEKKRQAFYDAVVKARSLQAAGEVSKGAEAWRLLADREPSNIIAHLEWSRCLEEKGEVREALRVVETIRATESKNVEVLFRAAELSLVLGNKTGALDNVRLVLDHSPTKRAARLARDIAADLGRFEEALEYEAQLERLGGIESSEASDTVAKFEYERIVSSQTTSDEDTTKALRKFHKSHPDFTPALPNLAHRESAAGNIDEATKLLLRAGKLTGDSRYWHTAAKMWLKRNQPDRALAALRSSVNDTVGEAKVRAELDLVRLYITLQMYSEAEKALAQLELAAHRESAHMTTDLSQQFLVLKGLTLTMTGDSQGATAIWKKLASSEYDLIDTGANPHLWNGSNEAPAARLSTP